MVLSIVYFLDCFSQSTLNEREAPYFHDFNWKRPDHALFLPKQVFLQKCSKVWTKINYGVIFKLKQICQIFIVE